MSINLNNISVLYGNHKALDQISVNFPKGAIGLLGINGAGKTTLIKAILGLVPISSGEGTLLNRKIETEGKAIRQFIGYMPENDCLIPGFNGVGMVQYSGQLSGMSRTDALQRAHEVLFYVGLEEARYRKVETYSVGMKQRIKLAQAIVHDPKILFLDEPTTGLDPKGREEMLELVRDIALNKNMSVIISSHILFDIERTCEHVVIIHKGKLLRQGKISELKGKHQKSYTIRIEGDREKFEKMLIENNCIIEKNGKHYTDVELPPQADTDLILKIAKQSDVQLRHLTVSIRSLEDVFIKIIGEN